MSEDINLIPVTELPVAEGDSVEVICLENGEMKRKPAEGLGGDEKYDMVIRTSCRPDYGSDVTDLDPANVSIIEGGFSNVLAAINENRVPVVLVETYHNDGNSGMLFSRTYASIYAYGGVYECVYFYGGKSCCRMSIQFSDDGAVASVSAYNF